jgi:hypothetical protein
MISGYVTQDVLFKTLVVIDRPRSGYILCLISITPLTTARYRVLRGLDTRQLVCKHASPFTLRPRTWESRNPASPAQLEKTYSIGVPPGLLPRIPRITSIMPAGESGPG